MMMNDEGWSMKDDDFKLLGILLYDWLTNGHLWLLSLFRDWKHISAFFSQNLHVEATCQI